MHMTDALLSPAVGTAMCAVSAAANAYAAVKIKNDELGEKKIPLMGVMGAFVFAAQMINFTIPAVGASGHIGGGILLAALLGGFPALISLSVVLIIQCFFFADGGLLALGCNIFNLGVIPCLLIYPLVFKPFMRKGITAGKLTAASILAVMVSLQLGAFSVVFETWGSGISELPFSAFMLFMQPIHLVIGLAEGVITAAVLGFVYKMRPEIMESTFRKSALSNNITIKKVILIFAVVTILLGGVFSLFASSHPDGLEWAMEKVTGTAELETEYSALENVKQIQDSTAFLPDYNLKNAGENDSGAGTAVSGIIGGVLTFMLAGAAAFTIAKVRKRHKANNEK